MQELQMKWNQLKLEEERAEVEEVLVQPVIRTKMRRFLSPIMKFDPRVDLKRLFSVPVFTGKERG